jgi:hypothetical protein
MKSQVEGAGSGQDNLLQITIKHIIPAKSENFAIISHKLDPLARVHGGPAEVAAFYPHALRYLHLKFY